MTTHNISKYTDRWGRGSDSLEQVEDMERDARNATMLANDVIWSLEEPQVDGVYWVKHFVSFDLERTPITKVSLARKMFGKWLLDDELAFGKTHEESLVFPVAWIAIDEPSRSNIESIFRKK